LSKVGQNVGRGGGAKGGWGRKKRLSRNLGTPPGTVVFRKKLQRQKARGGVGVGGKPEGRSENPPRQNLVVLLGAFNLEGKGLKVKNPGGVKQQLDNRGFLWVWAWWAETEKQKNEGNFTGEYPKTL